MATILSAFNNQIEEFTNELIKVFPEDNDFKTFKTSFLLLKKTNPRKIVDLFKRYVIPFSQKLLDKDEKYFLEENYHEMSSVNNGFLITNKLKKYWTELSDQTKEHIWDYFKILIVLSNKC
tara:strand:- start:106 stop:468 length:363 start_codon:yes stop_codon:yes gene_type:complete